MRTVCSAIAVGALAFLTGCPIPCGGSEIQQWWPEGETLEVAPDSTHASLDGTVSYTDQILVVRYADEQGNVWEAEYDLEPYE